MALPFTLPKLFSQEVIQHLNQLFADTVTLRERDSMKQVRVKIEELLFLLLPKIR